MTVGLAMIVLNEEQRIGRCLESVRPLIDRWTICDTGSTDRTRKIARQTLSGVTGGFRSHRWVGFGFNRTRAFQEAQNGSQYVLMVDADMAVEGSIPDGLTADAYYVKVVDGSGFEYRLPLLLRTDVNWCWHGRTHEYLDGGESSADLDTLRIRHHLDGAARPAKAARDVATLRADAARSLFYLAQTLREAGRNDDAIDAYRQRIAFGGGWDEEVFYARYQLGCLLCSTRSFEEGQKELMEAWRMRPERIEPLRALANVANHIADQAPIPDDRLFVHTDLYRRI